MPDLQFPYVTGQEDPTLEIIKKLLGLGQQPPQPTGFMGKLKMALPGMIQGGIDAASTPNIGMGGPIDIFRSLQTSQALKRSRDLSDRASNGQRVDDLLKYIDYQRRAKLDEERQRHDMATEDATTRTNQRLLDQNSETAQNQYLTGLSGFLKTGGQMRPKTTPLAPAPLPTGNVDVPSVDQLLTPQMMPSRSPSLSAQDTLAPGEMIVPGSTRDPADQVRVGLTPAEEARRLEEAKHADWPTVSPELAAKVPHFGVKAGQKVDPQTLREMQQAANALVLQENKPDARLPGSEQPLSAEEAKSLNETWNPTLTKHGRVLNPFRIGMPRAEATMLQTGLSSSLGAARADDKAPKGDPAVEKEYLRASAAIQKSFEKYQQQRDALDAAKSEISQGAVGQATGVIKTLSSLASGQGSGVRITQAELNTLIKARSLGEGFDAWISRMVSGKILPAEQVRQMTVVLNDVEKLATQKQTLYDETLDKLANATSTQEIRKIEGDLRKKFIGSSEIPAASAGGFTVGGSLPGVPGKIVGIRPKP